MAKLTIAEVQQKTTKGGKPYLNVKSSTGKWYYVWDDQQAIWHLIVAGATIEPMLSTSKDGKFTAITGIVGVEAENSVAGQILPKNSNLPNVYEWITEKLKEMDKKLDWLIQERKTLGELPKLEDLPVHNLEDKNPLE